jgi:hypothetical protein
MALTYLNLSRVLCFNHSHAIISSFDVRKSVSGDGGKIKLIDICGVDGLILGSWRVLLVSD